SNRRARLSRWWDASERVGDWGVLFMNLSQFVVLVFLSSSVLAKPVTVAVTPLGARTGDFCQVDRALLFEDPTGVRILYDAGRTVAGSDDPRLGDVNVGLLTHVHADR